jgi:hypothetical protein
MDIKLDLLYKVVEEEFWNMALIYSIFEHNSHSHNHSQSTST